MSALAATSVFVGARSYFPGVEQIRYEGPGTDNPLAFRHYDPERMVGGRTMREHLRFAACYWNSLCGQGADPFGPGTRRHPWDIDGAPLARAEARVDAAFEFFSKLGVPFYCFHDVDLAPEGEDVRESERWLAHMTALAAERQRESGVALLWGIANLCSHPRYAHGALTSPDFAVVARAGAQVKAALEATVALGGLQFTFWNGRDGYATLANTDRRREQAHMARFFAMARDYGRSIGFRGRFMIEPKAHEPMRHQYDADAATVSAFLREHGLDADFSVNVEANHANLAGHTFAHDVQVAIDAGLLGGLDINRGTAQNRWDTVRFPLDMHENVAVMLAVLRHGGIAPGGFNLDARLRRESVAPEDLFLGHIGAMDAFALALQVAHGLLSDSPLEDWRRARYATFDDGAGADFAAGRSTLAGLHAAARHLPLLPRSGREEAYESLLQQRLFRFAAASPSRFHPMDPST